MPQGPGISVALEAFLRIEILGPGNGVAFLDTYTRGPVRLHCCRSSAPECPQSLAELPMETGSLAGSGTPT